MSADTETAASNPANTTVNTTIGAETSVLGGNIIVWVTEHWRLVLLPRVYRKDDRTQSQIGQTISSHTFLRAVAIFFHVCDHIMSVVTYHINAISYLDSQKWVTGSSNVVLWVKIAEKMALNEGNWVPWPVSSMKLLKQSDKTNASGMKTMEHIANPGFIFTTKKIWRLPGW